MNEDAVGVLKVFHRVGNLGVTKDLKTSDGEPLAIPLGKRWTIFVLSAAETNSQSFHL